MYQVGGFMNSLSNPVTREIERVRHRRRLLAAEDEVVPSTRTGFKQLQQKLVNEADAAKERNRQLLQQVQEITQYSSSATTTAADAQLCSLRGAYLSLVHKTFPDWYQTAANQLQQQHTAAITQQQQQHEQQQHAAAHGAPQEFEFVSHSIPSASDNGQHSKQMYLSNGPSSQQHNVQDTFADSCTHSLHATGHAVGQNGIIEHSQLATRSIGGVQAEQGYTGGSGSRQPVTAPGLSPAALEQLANSMSEQLQLLQLLMQQQRQQQVMHQGQGQQQTQQHADVLQRPAEVAGHFTIADVQAPPAQLQGHVAGMPLAALDTNSRWISGPAGLVDSMQHPSFVQPLASTVGQHICPPSSRQTQQQWRDGYTQQQQQQQHQHQQQHDFQQMQSHPDRLQEQATTRTAAGAVHWQHVTEHGGEQERHQQQQLEQHLLEQQQQQDGLQHCEVPEPQTAGQQLLQQQSVQPKSAQHQQQQQQQQQAWNGVQVTQQLQQHQQQQQQLQPLHNPLEQQLVVGTAVPGCPDAALVLQPTTAAQAMASTASAQPNLHGADQAVNSGQQQEQLQPHAPAAVAELLQAANGSSSTDGSKAHDLHSDPNQQQTALLQPDLSGSEQQHTGADAGASTSTGVSTALGQGQQQQPPHTTHSTAGSSSRDRSSISGLPAVATQQLMSLVEGVLIRQGSGSSSGSEAPSVSSLPLASEDGVSAEASYAAAGDGHVQSAVQPVGVALTTAQGAATDRRWSHAGEQAAVEEVASSTGRQGDRISYNLTDLYDGDNRYRQQSAGQQPVATVGNVAAASTSGQTAASPAVDGRTAPTTAGPAAAVYRTAATTMPPVTADPAEGQAATTAVGPAIAAAPAAAAAAVKSPKAPPPAPPLLLAALARAHSTEQQQPAAGMAPSNSRATSPPAKPRGSTVVAAIAQLQQTHQSVANPAGTSAATVDKSTAKPQQSQKLGISSLAFGWNAGAAAAPGTNSISSDTGRAAAIQGLNLQQQPQQGPLSFQRITSAPSHTQPLTAGMVLSPATRLSLGAVGNDAASSSGRPSLSSETTDAQTLSPPGSSMRLSLGLGTAGGMGGNEMVNTKLRPPLRIPDAAVPGSKRSSLGGANVGGSAAVLQEQQQQPQGEQDDEVFSPLSAGVQRLGSGSIPQLALGKLVSQQQQQQPGAAAQAVFEQEPPLQRRERQQQQKQQPLPSVQLTPQPQTRAAVHKQYSGKGGSGRKAGGLASKVLKTGLTDFGDSDSDDDGAAYIARPMSGKAGPGFGSQAAVTRAMAATSGPGPAGVGTAGVLQRKALTGLKSQGSATDDEFDF